MKALVWHVDIEDGPKMYKTFRDKAHGCIKVVLKPHDQTEKRASEAAPPNPAILKVS
jgi:hypothetical protein